jgi:hypothetical protein
MRHENRHNEEYMKAKRAEVASLAKALMVGEIGIIEGSRKLCNLKYEVSEDDGDPDFTQFAAIESETDHLPVGPVREHWSPEALLRKDLEIKKVEDFYRSRIVEPCKKLIERLGDQA